MPVSADVALEMERLRAERDALAAELQIERAERLRAEERLRLFEREKLEQMREGAASRERLASELEEARLRAMSAEARQAALEAEMRLAEISRRRGNWPPAGADSAGDAGERAEPEPGEALSDEESMRAGLGRDAQARPRRAGYGVKMPAAFSKYSRQARQANAGRDAARTDPRPLEGADDADPPHREERPPSARPESSGSRFAAGGGDAASKPGTGGANAPRGGSDAAGSAGSAGSRSGGLSDRDRAAASSFGRGSSPMPPPRSGSSGGSGGGSAGAGARGGPAGARGGAAAGRPSIDRGQLEARLAAGQAIETTDRFRQFQPVAQTHIKICDWLSRANTLDDIERLAAGEVARNEIVNALALFFERSFLVFKA